MGDVSLVCVHRAGEREGGGGGGVAANSLHDLEHRGREGREGVMKK